MNGEVNDAESELLIQRAEEHKKLAKNQKVFRKSWHGSRCPSELIIMHAVARWLLESILNAKSNFINSMVIDRMEISTK